VSERPLAGQSLQGLVVGAEHPFFRGLKGVEVTHRLRALLQAFAQLGLGQIFGVGSKSGEDEPLLLRGVLREGELFLLGVDFRHRPRLIVGEMAHHLGGQGARPGAGFKKNEGAGNARIQLRRLMSQQEPALRDDVHEIRQAGLRRLQIGRYLGPVVLNFRAEIIAGVVDQPVRAPLLDHCFQAERDEDTDGDTKQLAKKFAQGVGGLGLVYVHAS
jgi:hypothetical protein